MENSIGPRQSPMEVLGMDRGWVGNGCGPNRRIGHGYDNIHELLQHAGVMQERLLRVPVERSDKTK